MLFNNEFESEWTGAVVAYFKVVSWNFAGGAEDSHDSVSGDIPIFQYGTS
jgi:hypothetical protein